MGRSAAGPLTDLAGARAARVRRRLAGEIAAIDRQRDAGDVARHVRREEVMEQPQVRLPAVCTRGRLSFPLIMNVEAFIMNAHAFVV